MADKLEQGFAKQEAFLNQWVSGDGIEFIDDNAKSAYQYRAGLIRDAIQLKKNPDRVPIVPLAIFAPIDLYGQTGKNAMY